MSGVDDDADGAVVLTTNRPEVLEPALALRPGRVNLAVEIPIPDAAARGRLLDVYSRGLDTRIEHPDRIVERTDGMTASFFKELLRAATLLAAEAGELAGDPPRGRGQPRRAPRRACRDDAGAARGPPRRGGRAAAVQLRRILSASGPAGSSTRSIVAAAAGPRRRHSGLDGRAQRLGGGLVVGRRAPVEHPHQDLVAPEPDAARGGVGLDLVGRAVGGRQRRARPAPRGCPRARACAGRGCRGGPRPGRSRGRPRGRSASRRGPGARGRSRRRRSAARRTASCWIQPWKSGMNRAGSTRSGFVGVELHADPDGALEGGGGHRRAS